MWGSRIGLKIREADAFSIGLCHMNHTYFIHNRRSLHPPSPCQGFYDICEHGSVTAV